MLFEVSVFMSNRNHFTDCFGIVAFFHMILPCIGGYPCFMVDGLWGTGGYES